MRPSTKPVKPNKDTRILVVDDSVTMRLYMTTILKSLGYDVTEADSGAAGFDKILAAEFDLVITDLEMQPMNGMELVAAIGLLPAWRRPRVIVCTSEPHKADRITAQELRRVDCVLEKPFQLHDLAKAVGDALANATDRGVGGLCGT